MKTKRLSVLKFMIVVLLLGCSLVVMAQIHPGMQQRPGVGVKITWGSDGVKVKSGATARQVPVPGMPVTPTYLNRSLDPLQKKNIEKAAVEGPNISTQEIKDALSRQNTTTENRMGLSQSAGLRTDSILQRRIDLELHKNSEVTPVHQQNELRLTTDSITIQ